MIRHYVKVADRIEVFGKNFGRMFFHGETILKNRKKQMKTKFLVAVICTVFAFVLSAGRLADYQPPAAEQHRTVFSEDFEAKGKGWVLPKGYSFRRGEGVDETGGLSLTRIDRAVPYSFAKYRVHGFRPMRRYRLSAMIRVEDLKQDGKTPVSINVPLVGFNFYVGKNYLGSSCIHVTVKRGNADWRPYSCEFNVPEKVESASLCFFLKKPFTCARISWDNVKVEELGEVVPVIYPVLPKKLLLSGDGKVKMRVNDLAGRRPGGLKLFATLPGGIEYGVPVHGNFAEFTFGPLPEGETAVKFTLVDLAGKRVIAQADYPFFTVSAKPPAGAATVDESGRMIVDGKPFFPLGFFIERPAGFTAADMERLRAIGVNTLLPYRSINMRFPENRGPRGVRALRRSLNELRKHDLKVIFSLLEITGRLHEVKKYDGIIDKKEMTRHIVNAIKNHPALLGWYISDENAPETLGPVRDLRLELARLDPWHPVATLSNHPHHYPWFGPTGDFMMLDKYPVRTKSQPLSMSLVRKCFETEAKVLGLGPWWVSQCFNWGIYRKEEPYENYRYPSEEDMRSQSLLALNHRARAVIFYAYESIRRQDAFDPGSSKWFEPRVFQVIRLLKELEPFFLAEAAPQTVMVIPSDGAPSRVEAKLHTAAGRSIVVVTADGPGRAHAMLKIGRTGLKSRFGRTKELGGGNYEFTGEDIASDILE